MSEELGGVWTAVWALARSWSDTPSVRKMAASLPDRAFDAHEASGRDAVVSMLQGLRASAASLFARPTLLGTMVPFMFRSGIPLPPGVAVDPPSLQQWLVHATKVELAHRTTLAWLRSRLPGYPMLRVPQLAVNSHLTTMSYSSSFNWVAGELAAGHQFDPAPAGVPGLLGARGRAGGRLDEDARRLGAALAAVPEWREFQAAGAELGPADREALSAARRELQRELARADESAGPGMFDRDAFRQRAAERSVERLRGSARRYCTAFDALNALIDVCAGHVFGQLALLGPPRGVVAHQIDFPCPGHATIVERDESAHSIFGRHPGDLVRVDDPLLPDALLVEGHTVRLDHVEGPSSTLRLRILEGSSVWPSTGA